MMEPRKKFEIKALLVSVWALGALAASGEAYSANVGAYRAYIKEPDKHLMTEIYAVGLTRGLLMTNSLLIEQGEKPAYCVPKNLNINTAFVNSLIKSELNNPLFSSPYKNDDELEPIVMFALLNKYPCRRS